LPAYKNLNNCTNHPVLQKSMPFIWVYTLLHY